MVVAENVDLLFGFVCHTTEVAVFVVVVSRLFGLVADVHLIVDAVDFVVVVAADVAVVVVAVVVVVRAVFLFSCLLLFLLHFSHSLVFVDVA